MLTSSLVKACHNWCPSLTLINSVKLTIPYISSCVITTII